MEVKNLEEKLNKRNKPKNAWNEEEYIKYKEQVGSARIDAINSLISEFNNWSVLSDEEEDHLKVKLIEDLKNYVNLLYKINEELNDCIEYLKGE